MMIVRDAKPSDENAIYQVVFSAFGRVAEARLVGDLDRAGDVVIALVAEEDGHIVGHVLLSRMSASFRALALGPVSVAVEKQRKGIGSALIWTAIKRARNEGWIGIFVLGDPKYYGRFGFNAEDAAGFTTPYAGSRFTVLPLAPRLLAVDGDLHHASAFAALDRSDRHPE
jgi:putative acetyltransferase